MSDKKQATNYTNSLKNFCAAVLENKPQVAVYSNNYLGAHIRALQNVYLTVQHYLEADVFSALALVYVKHYPPTQWDINIYGENFPRLIAAQTNSNKAGLVDWLFIATVAQIEHAISRAYYGYISKYELLTPFTKTANNTQFISELQKRHPYTKIEKNLVLNQVIEIQLIDYKIYLRNNLPT